MTDIEFKATLQMVIQIIKVIVIGCQSADFCE